MNDNLLIGIAIGAAIVYLLFKNSSGECQCQSQGVSSSQETSSSVPEASANPSCVDGCPGASSTIPATSLQAVPVGTPAQPSSPLSPAVSFFTRNTNYRIVTPTIAASVMTPAPTPAPAPTPIYRAPVVRKSWTWS